MIVLGIDSGIERTGYAIVTNEKGKIEYIASGLIKTLSQKSIPARLLEIQEKILKVIDQYKPAVVVLEQIFFFKNQKTIVAVAQAQGVIQVLAAKHGLPIEFLTPLQIKQIITGYGRADKIAMLKMVQLTLPTIKFAGKIDDEIDAIACALAFCYQNKSLI